MAFDLGALFQAHSTQLTWARLPASNVGDGSPSAQIEKHQAYFSVRLKEMYVGFSRKLWIKFYPMLYSFVDHGAMQQNTVAGPGQLREFGDANLERIINLNYPLTGPIVYTGADVTMLIGLYSVRGEDTARALIDLTASLAAIGGLAVGTAAEAANVVKGGVEKILGLRDSTLQLGVRDTVNAGKGLHPGVYVGINAPSGSVDLSRLWLKDGRLVQGADPTVAKPYRDRDYMVVEIERLDARSDWAKLPGLADFEPRFNAILRDAARTSAQKRTDVSVAFVAFRDMLATSPQLTVPDRANIATSVAEDLKRRVADLEGNLFPSETKSLVAAEERDAGFDFADIKLVMDFSNRGSVERAIAAFHTNPFA